LFHRGVPDVTSPLCRCGLDTETAAHLILECPATTPRPTFTLSRPLRDRYELEAATSRPASAKAITVWVHQQTRLPEYRIVREIFADAERPDAAAGPLRPSPDHA